MVASRVYGKERTEFVNAKGVFFDTKALALNNLPSKYVLTISGEAYAKVDGMMNQNQVDIMAVVTKASLVVNQKYSHPLNEVILHNPEKWE